MTKPWLSILLPSIRRECRIKFLKSLDYNSTTADKRDIQIIADSVKYDYPIKGFNFCFNHCEGEWIWLANDDLTCETKGWDTIFKQCTEMFDDGVAMFFPNDTLFKNRFPCFPLVKKELVAELFPSPYRRYKIDDGIRDVIPSERIFYLPNVVMRHDRASTDGYGFNLGDGRVYIQDPIDMQHDHRLYETIEQVNLREKLLRSNTKLMKLDNLAGVV